jgi:hypothetical protein
MKKFILITAVFCSLSASVLGQTCSLILGHSVNQNMVKFTSPNESIRRTSTSLAPIIGFELQHTDKMSSCWLLKTNNAFNSTAIGDLFNYTFHFNDLSMKLDYSFMELNRLRVYFSGGVAAQIVTEARQSVGNFQYNLLEGGIEKYGSTVFFGMGSRGYPNSPISLVTDLRYNLGLTNFEQEVEQSTHIGSISFNILLRINVDALNQSKNE